MSLVLINNTWICSFVICNSYYFGLNYTCVTDFSSRRTDNYCKFVFQKLAQVWNKTSPPLSKVNIMTCTYSSNYKDSLIEYSSNLLVPHSKGFPQKRTNPLECKYSLDYLTIFNILRNTHKNNWKNFLRNYFFNNILFFNQKFVHN